MNRLLNIVVGLLLAGQIFSQLPNTDVWLFELCLNKQKQTVLCNPQNISNREGYDNQPSFAADKRSLYYVSIREDKQADIYQFDLKKKLSNRFTSSKESEYSPTVTGDKHQLATVMVEKDSTQRLHFLNGLTGLDEGVLDVDSIGYFTFLNTDTLVYYKLTQPHSLRIHSRSTKEDHWLCNQPIRNFKAVNRHCVIYGIKDSVSVACYKYDLQLQRAQRFAEYPAGSEDIYWDDQLGLLRSEGTSILRYDEIKQTWTLLYDLSSFGLRKITRFCFDPQRKYLAVVNNL